MIDDYTIILSGGFGTRLKSISKNKPKALVEINGIPFLKIILKNLVRNGYRKFIFSLFYEYQQIIDFIQNLDIDLKQKIDYKFNVEPKALGTGGAIKHCIDSFNLTGFVNVINSDTWIEKGLAELKNKDNNLISVIKLENNTRYGEVIFDENKVIKGFEEKNEKRNCYINAGFYRLKCELFRKFSQESFSIERDFFPEIINKINLYAYELESKFIDIGIPDDLERFKKIIINER